jgi:flagellar hook-associated protein 1 FlgK
VSKQSADTSQAATDLTNATAYQTTVASALSSGSGVNVDQQVGLMIQLQNSYQANAQVMTAANTMFNALLNIFAQSA